MTKATSRKELKMTWFEFLDIIGLYGILGVTIYGTWFKK